MKLSISLVLLSSLLGVIATTPEQLILDMTKITSQTTSLDSNIKALKPSSDLTGAWGLHDAARNIIASIKAATENAKVATSKPVSRDYDRDSLAAGDNLRSAIVTALSDMVEKKDTVAALPIPGSTAVVRNDLSDLKAASKDYQTALLNGAQGDSRPAALGVIDSINKAFDSAIAAYSS